MLTSLLAATLALQAAPAEPPPLSQENRALLRCAVAFAMVSGGQANGDAQAMKWPGLGTRVLNVDDAFGAALAGRLDAPGRVIVTGRAAQSAALIAKLAAQGAGWVRAESVELAGSGQQLRIASHLGRCELRSTLIGA